MSKTYKAIGINLKAQALGESDRLVTILTKEYGLIRAVAPGARKHNSSLSGRSGVFVINELLIAKGRSLDKITQAQTVKSYPGLAKDLIKLAASQYLAEIVLCQALSEQPQEELYELFDEHLSRLDTLPNTKAGVTIAHLAHGIFHLLALAGLTPQVQCCCITGRSLAPNWTDPNWQVGFSIPSGGTVCLTAWERLKAKVSDNQKVSERPSLVKEKPSAYHTVVHQQDIPILSKRINAQELTLFQHLSQPEIMQGTAREDGWLSIEQILRQYVQYHLGRPIRSAALIDSYFSVNHDATI